jgi:hypothetical protein
MAARLVSADDALMTHDSATYPTPRAIGRAGG